MPARVPLLFGTGSFGAPGTETRTHDPLDAQKFIDVLVGHGYTGIDTARRYGRGTSEELIAKLDLKGARVDTKIFPVKPGDHAPEKFRELFEQSIKALGPHKIRVLYLHAPDRTVPFEDTLSVVNELYKEGKFEEFGLSNYHSWEVAEIVGIAKAKGWVQPTVYQGVYNALDRTIETELVPCIRKYGLRFVAYSPLAGGFLVGKVLSEAPGPGSSLDPNSFRGAWFQKKYSHMLPILQNIKELVDKHGELRLSEIALRWLQHHSIFTPEDGGVILGASSPHQLEESIKDSEGGPLPDDIVNALDEAWKKVKGGTRHYAAL